MKYEPVKYELKAKLSPSVRVKPPLSYPSYLLLAALWACGSTAEGPGLGGGLHGGSAGTSGASFAGSDSVGGSAGSAGAMSSGGNTQPNAGGRDSGAAGMSSGAGGSTSAAGASAEPTPPIPTVNGACSPLKSGSTTVLGTQVQLWVGSKAGPLYFYWHGTGQDYTEVERGMPGASEGVATRGGIVASFDTSNKRGTNTGNGVWYTGDFEAADQILACGVAQGLVETRRIYTAGYSAGGLQACAMVAAHGAYLAAAICYSGGAATISGAPRDNSNLPPTLLLHGAAGRDTFILDFARASASWARAYRAAGGFAIDCDDGGDHVASAFSRMGFGGRAMAFFDAHPYKIDPEPYANGLPSGWPSTCVIAD